MVDSIEMPKTMFQTITSVNFLASTSLESSRQ